MPATIIDGRDGGLADPSRGCPRGGRPARAGRQVPGLATILVGDDPASAVYVANKRKACAEVGIADHHRHLSTSATQQGVAAAIEEANPDAAVSGILLQLPSRRASTALR